MKSDVRILNIIGRKNTFVVFLLLDLLQFVSRVGLISMAVIAFLALVVVNAIGSGLIVVAIVEPHAKPTESGELLFAVTLIGGLLHVVQWMIIIHPFAKQLEQYKREFERKYPLRKQ